MGASKLSTDDDEIMNIVIQSLYFAGAFGYFKVTNDISDLTRASFLQPGKVTNVFTRFSTQVGEIGSADTTVDAKGFSIKFYTEDGNHDILGLNLPVFGTREAMLLPDFLHSRMKNPQTHVQDLNMFWDISSERPETMLFILFFFSRTAYTRSYRFIDGFAIHTFKLVNRNNKPIYAKFIFTSDAKDKKYFTTVEALTAAGFTPEYLTKELYDSIATKHYPTWTLNLQIMTYKQAEHFRYSPFDATKYWNTTEFPLIPVGKLVLNRNPHNYFNDVEQSAFCPTRLVPGIETTPDRLLHARMFAYHDAQLYRLGVNNDQIPVNRCPFGTKNYERDGFMNVGSNGGNGPNYFPNTFNGPTNNNNPYYNELPFEVCGDVDRIDLGDEDNFSQCKSYMNSLSADEIEALVENMSFAFTGVNPRITQKVMNNLINPVSKNLGIKLQLAIKKMASSS